MIKYFICHKSGIPYARKLDQESMMKSIYYMLRILVLFMVLLFAGACGQDNGSAGADLSPGVLVQNEEDVIPGFETVALYFYECFTRPPIQVQNPVKIGSLGNTQPANTAYPSLPEGCEEVCVVLNEIVQAGQAGAFWNALLDLFEEELSQPCNPGASENFHIPGVSCHKPNPSNRLSVAAQHAIQTQCPELAPYFRPQSASR